MVDESSNLPERLDESLGPIQGEKLTEILSEIETIDSRSPALEMPLLAASGLTKRFGGIRAIDNASIEVAKGSITGLIGPNGAGKTTLFNLLSNFIRPDQGRILFDGEPVQNLPPYQIAQMGMVRTFQVARTLSRLSVLENMLLATQHQTGEKFWNTWFRSKQINAEERQHRERAMTVLESIGLVHMANEYAGALSGGQRKLLEMGRALMANQNSFCWTNPRLELTPDSSTRSVIAFRTGTVKVLPFDH